MNGSSFFLNIGCKKALQGYSVFLETGYKKEEQSNEKMHLEENTPPPLAASDLPPDDEDNAFISAVAAFEARQLAMQSENMEEIAMLSPSPFDVSIDLPFSTDLPYENYQELTLDEPTSFVWALFEEATPEPWVADVECIAWKEEIPPALAATPPLLQDVDTDAISLTDVEYIAWQEEIVSTIATVAHPPLQDVGIDAISLTDLPSENYKEAQLTDVSPSFAWALFDEAALEPWVADVECIAWKEEIAPILATTVTHPPLQDACVDAISLTDLPSENYKEPVTEASPSFAWALFDEAALEPWIADVESIAWKEESAPTIATTVTHPPLQDACVDAISLTDLPSENYKEDVTEAFPSFAWALFDEAALEPWIADVECIAWKEEIAPPLATVTHPPLQDVGVDAISLTDCPSEHYEEHVTTPTIATVAHPPLQDVGVDAISLTDCPSEHYEEHVTTPTLATVTHPPLQDVSVDAISLTDWSSENYQEAALADSPPSFAWEPFEDAALESWMPDVEYIAWKEDVAPCIAVTPLPLQDIDPEVLSLGGASYEVIALGDTPQEAPLEISQNFTNFLELDRVLTEFATEEFFDEPNVENEIATAKEDVEQSEREIILCLLEESKQPTIAPVDPCEQDILSTITDFEMGIFDQEPEISFTHCLVTEEEESEIPEAPVAVELPPPQAPPPFLAVASPPPPPPVTDTNAWDPYPWPRRIVLSHVIGHQDEVCVPFATNFTTLEILLAPEYRLGHILPMIDLLGHRFDNTLYAANVGLGGRYIPSPSSSFCELLGFNAFYDYRQSCFGYFQQFGVGVEILGRRWDIRGNIYVPFGERSHGRKCLFDHYSDGYFAIREDVELVSYSFNAEVGFSAIKGKNFLLYLAAGPYFIAGRICADNTPGVEVRLRPQYKDYLYLDLSYRYDDLFKTIWQAKIAVVLPLYQISGKNKRPCGISDRQIYQSIERFEVLPVDSQTFWQTNY